MSAGQPQDHSATLFRWRQNTESDTDSDSLLYNWADLSVDCNHGRERTTVSSLFFFFQEEWNLLNPLGLVLVVLCHENVQRIGK